MPKEQSPPGKPTTSRYSSEAKANAVRMVRTLRAEFGTEHGVPRVGERLGYGVESVRCGVLQADVGGGPQPRDEHRGAKRIRGLEQRNRGLKRANKVLKRAASFVGTEFHRQHKE